MHGAGVSSPTIGAVRWYITVLGGALIFTKTRLFQIPFLMLQGDRRRSPSAITKTRYTSVTLCNHHFQGLSA
ncbi:hypothetical protein CEP52_006743 [Fusarium oligoseptatum]|uniref:Uncharacterized protein n=1 Tax=Fusarium oligoseptatum TaxID=2604345 RepID=A0A428TRC5_9HYPO|nr:hypothetical protein CEP52_006743 [Fusarium oligoseptatum]